MNKTQKGLVDQTGRSLPWQSFFPLWGKEKRSRKRKKLRELQIGRGLGFKSRRVQMRTIVLIHLKRMVGFPLALQSRMHYTCDGRPKGSRVPIPPQGRGTKSQAAAESRRDEVPVREARGNPNFGVNRVQVTFSGYLGPVNTFPDPPQTISRYAQYHKNLHQ